jgi:hypothetical protein
MPAHFNMCWVALLLDIDLQIQHYPLESKQHFFFSIVTNTASSSSSSSFHEF